MDHRDTSRTIIERAPLDLPRSILLAAVVGGAFGLGLVAGDGGAAHAATADDGDAIESAEARTARYEALVKASTSTWHRELTTRDPPTALAALPRAKATTTSKTPTSAPSAPASSSPAPAETPSSAPTVAAEVVQAMREPRPAAVDTHVEAEPEARAANDDRTDQVGDADRAVAPDPQRLARAIERVVGERSQAASASSDEARRYALQLASTGTEAGARAIADGFRARGFAPTVVAAEVPGRGTVYRVRIGGLADRAAAEAMKDRVGQGLVVSE
jgi:cell division septation protein DedD